MQALVRRLVLALVMTALFGGPQVCERRIRLSPQSRSVSRLMG